MNANFLSMVKGGWAKTDAVMQYVERIRSPLNFRGELSNS
jgi:hypothetical protein